MEVVCFKRSGTKIATNIFLASSSSSSIDVRCGVAKGDESEIPCDRVNTGDLDHRWSEAYTCVPLYGMMRK